MIHFNGEIIGKCMSFPSDMKVMFLDVEANEYYTIEGVGQFENKLDTVVIAGKKEVR